MKKSDLHMRALIIDEEARRKVAKVVEYARRPEHWYDPAASVNPPIPGDDGNMQVHLDTFRCVFSFTLIRGKLWRHLSVSIPGTKYPKVFATLTIAELFGFTGWDGKSEIPPHSFAITLNMNEHCVVLAQPAGEENDRQADTDIWRR